MDIDGDGQVLAATDGQLMVRWMFGARGAELITGAVAVVATRTTAAAIEAYITDNQAMLDVDGNGTADALTDGILVLRYLNGGYTGITLTDQALAIDAKRILPADITRFLASLM